MFFYKKYVVFIAYLRIEKVYLLFEKLAIMVLLKVICKQNILLHTKRATYIDTMHPNYEIIIHFSNIDSYKFIALNLLCLVFLFLFAIFKR